MSEQMTTAELVALPAIELRDYFIAHAPATPWEWFKPTLPAGPAEPPVAALADDGSAPDSAQAYSLHQWRVNAMAHTPKDGPPSLPEHLPTFSKWCDAWRLYWRDLHDFKRLVERERSIQWPAFWADMMLADRTAPAAAAADARRYRLIRDGMLTAEIADMIAHYVVAGGDPQSLDEVLDAQSRRSTPT